MPPKPPNTRNSDATRSALLKAGSEQFAQLGYSGCRNQQLADAAGVNKAMINYHFGGKLGLYRAVVTEAVDATQPLIEEFRRTSVDLPVADKMAAWIRTIDECFRLNRFFPRLLLREHLDGGLRLQKEFLERISLFYKTTAWVLSDLPEHSRPNAHSVHLSLIGSLMYYLASQPYRDQADREGTTVAPAPVREDYINYIVQLHSQALRNPKGTTP